MSGREKSLGSFERVPEGLSWLVGTEHFPIAGRYAPSSVHALVPYAYM